MKTLILLLMIYISEYVFAGQAYTIVDTDQIRCYNNTTEIEYPKAGEPFFG